MQRNIIGLASLTVVAGGLGASPVFAQTIGNTEAIPPATNGPMYDRAADGSVGDIVVTARRRQERLQDVPISISVANRATIQARDSVRVNEIAATIPNVTFSPGALPTITVRGISSQTRPNAGFDSGVGVYVDGVVQGKLYTFDSPLYDVDRVEFLRGPQGTLFGKNAVAGAINITTRNPSFTPTVDASGEFGSYHRLQLQAFASAPLSSKFAVSVGGFRLKRDGYVVNDFDNSRIANDDSYGGRAKLLFKPSNAVQFILSGDYLHEDNYSYVGEIVSGYGSASATYHTNVDTPTKAFRRVYGTSLTGEFGLGDNLSLTSITAYRGARTDRTNDTDVGPVDVVHSLAQQKQNQLTQEVRLNGRISSRLNFVLGGFYYWQKTDNFAASRFGDITNVPGFLRGLTGNTFGSIVTKSIAGFGSVDWQVVSTVTLTAGLRYTHEAKDLDYQQIGFPIIAPYLPQQQDHISSDDLSPTITLRYTPSRHLMVYATASRGFKSGGWNLDNVVDTSITRFSQVRFADEDVWNYELGLKSQFFDNRVTFNAAAFQERYNNIQTPQLTPVLGGGGAVVSIVTNAGQATINGAEAELSVRPLEVLTLSAAAGYTDAHYTRYLDNGVSFAGNKLPGAPNFNSNLSATLRIPFTPTLAFGLRGEYVHVSKVFGDRENSQLRVTPALDTVNASTGIYGKRFDLVAFANNLFDDRTITQVSNGGFGFPGIGTNVIVARRLGRTLGIRLGIRY